MDGLTPNLSEQIQTAPIPRTCLPTYHTHVIVTTTTRMMIKQACHYLSFVSSSQLSTAHIEMDGQTTGAVNDQTTLSRSTIYATYTAE